ncbi:ABC transporter ATP-binding protein [Cohnella terricola]|uniref:Carnitine transport ATP-binding protein OpuCA n=1 Tax=Cohnella terricola TaxID=1289167 RepID=A0A559JA25_9BACL|nr:ABC transporter ATP-binding protein [Cohnella terricola]TVX96697.1 ABC transporter ATP-binding protein [Cohnella terricola]
MSELQPHIRIDNVTKSFGSYSAIRNVCLDIPRGSFTTLLGPSGCGKTTLMRLIAGFDEPDSGSILIDGAEMNGIPAFRRKTPLVFQEYALFPHMTVYENIAYGLKLQKVPRDEIRRKVGEMLEMFGLEGLGDRQPKQLSGGQQQRVAFARALVTGQDILLMDEPLSNLDAKMRVEVRNELRELQQRAGITAVFVTHDQDEALSLSDRIAVFDKGRICQAGTPWEVYFKPDNAFVADFVGTANFIPGEVAAVEGGELVVRCEGAHHRVDGGGRSFSQGDQVTLVVRPECISISMEAGPEGSAGKGWSGEIMSSSFLGRMVRYRVRCGSMTYDVDDASPSVRGVLQGSVRLQMDSSKIHVLLGSGEL